MQKENSSPAEIDFSERGGFPGEEGNTFDIILKRLARIDAIPDLPFALLLLAIASLITFFQWPAILILFGFFLSDWLLLSLLPRLRISYGPPKPPALILAVFRSVFALLPFQVFLFLQAVGTLLIIYGFFFEPHHIKVTRQRLVSPKLRQGTSMRVLHLGDLHVERITRRELQLNQMIEDLKPDLILFSGDILNLSYVNDPAAWTDARRIISEWKAPLGVFLVSGSPAVDLPENMPELLKNLPIHWLKQDRFTIHFQENEIDLYGITCSHRPNVDAPILQRIVKANEEHLSILLYHSPDLAPISARSGIDLQLSGHTHGGQVRIPFLGALVTGSLYGKGFEAGRYRINGMVLYITRGIGMEGAGAPRVRFLCPPEIILWEIVSP